MQCGVMVIVRIVSAIGLRLGFDSKVVFGNFPHYTQKSLGVGVWV